MAVKKLQLDCLSQLIHNIFVSGIRRVIIGNIIMGTILLITLPNP